MESKRTFGGRISLVCERCGHPFTRPSSRVKDHHFCSRACYFASGIPNANARKANKTRFPEGGVLQIPCSQCGVQFARFRSQLRSGVMFCSWACMKAYAVDQPVRQITSQGYIRIFVGRDYPGSSGHGHIYEHRKVFEEFLGRTLAPHENVHHVNGQRADNRLENLELWSSSQPSGQRIEDKLRWAREFIAQYEGSPLM